MSFSSVGLLFNIDIFFLFVCSRSVGRSIDRLIWVWTEIWMYTHNHRFGLLSVTVNKWSCLIQADNLLLLFIIIFLGKFVVWMLKPPLICCVYVLACSRARVCVNGYMNLLMYLFLRQSLICLLFTSIRIHV